MAQSDSSPQHLEPIGCHVLTLVAGGRVIQFEVELVPDDPRLMKVTASVDFGPKWFSAEPGWRDLGFGVADDRPYWWSARQLVVLPIHEDGEPVTFKFNEDILSAFPIEGAWLVVCETSIRLVDEAIEVTRLEMADVIVETRLQGKKLRLLDAEHRLFEITKVGTNLIASEIR